MQVVIQKFEKETPRKHIAKIKVLVDDKTIYSYDGYDCEFIEDGEARMNMIFNVVKNLSSSLGVSVLEEYRTIN